MPTQDKSAFKKLFLGMEAIFKNKCALSESFNALKKSATEKKVVEKMFFGIDQNMTFNKFL